MKLIRDWKTYAAAALAAFVAGNEILQLVDAGVQHTIVAVAAALGIVLTSHTDAKVEETKKAVEDVKGRL